MSNSGSPKNASAPWSEKVMSSRRITPAVADDRPPSDLRSALPSSDVRYEMTAAQVLDVEQGEAVLVGVVEHQAQARLLGLVEPEHLREQRGPERGDRWPGSGFRCRGRRGTGTPSGMPWPTHCCPTSVARAVSLSLACPAVAIPDRSPLMSARKTGTPWAESCSAMSWSVLVLPVPVAPATRPCRLRVASGMRTGASGMGLAVDDGGAEVQAPVPRRRSRRGSPRAARPRHWWSGACPSPRPSPSAL